MVPERLIKVASDKNQTSLGSAPRPRQGFNQTSLEEGGSGGKRGKGEEGKGERVRGKAVRPFGRSRRTVPSTVASRIFRVASRILCKRSAVVFEIHTLEFPVSLSGNHPSPLPVSLSPLPLGSRSPFPRFPLPVPLSSDHRHQPSHFPLNIFFAPVGEKQICAAHRTQRRGENSSIVNSR